jgi:hypothetical protein
MCGLSHDDEAACVDAAKGIEPSHVDCGIFCIMQMHRRKKYSREHSPFIPRKLAVYACNGRWKKDLFFLVGIMAKFGAQWQLAKHACDARPILRAYGRVRPTRLRCPVCRLN